MGNCVGLALGWAVVGALVGAVEMLGCCDCEGLLDGAKDSVGATVGPIVGKGGDLVGTEVGNGVETDAGEGALVGPGLCPIVLVTREVTSKPKRSILGEKFALPRCIDA